jgi:hypothetical protein
VHHPTAVLAAAVAGTLMFTTCAAAGTRLTPEKS